MIIAALMILFIVGFVWLEKKALKRWRPPMEDD